MNLVRMSIANSDFGKVLRFVQKRDVEFMFYDKFKLLCDRKGVSCNRAATDMGLSNSTPTKWKKTGATPDGATLSKISAYFGVPVGDLLTNDSTEAIEFTVSVGELLDNLQNKKAPAETGKRSNDSDILDEVDIAFYGDYKELTEENKETLRAMARLFRERQGKQE